MSERESEFIFKWCDGGENLFVHRLREIFGDDQIVLILKIIDSTCHECWDDTNDCQCWNDE